MQINNGQFWHGDCLELMRDIPSGSVDMVVTSPPYDNLRTYNGMPAFTFDVFRPIADQLARVIKPGGVIVWNVADATVNGSETGSSFRQALYFKDECGLNLHDTMIWQKMGMSGVGSPNRYYSTFEYMFVFSKGVPNSANMIVDRANKTAGRDMKGSTKRGPDGITKPVSNPNRITQDFGKRFNVWEVPAETRGSLLLGHPAVFPVSIPQDHILSWSNPGDTVLDPFAGSGTTAVAAERTGRQWICIERDEEYYLRACARVLDL